MGAPKNNEDGVIVAVNSNKSLEALERVLAIGGRGRLTDDFWGAFLRGLEANVDELMDFTAPEMDENHWGGEKMPGATWIEKVTQKFSPQLVFVYQRDTLDRGVEKALRSLDRPVFYLEPEISPGSRNSLAAVFADSGSGESAYLERVFEIPPILEETFRAECARGPYAFYLVVPGVGEDSTLEILSEKLQEAQGLNVRLDEGVLTIDSERTGISIKIRLEFSEWPAGCHQMALNHLRSGELAAVIEGGNGPPETWYDEQTVAEIVKEVLSDEDGYEDAWQRFLERYRKQNASRDIAKSVINWAGFSEKPTPRRQVVISGFFGQKNLGDAWLLEELCTQASRNGFRIVVAAEDPEEVQSSTGVRSFKRTDVSAAEYCVRQSDAVVLSGALMHDHSFQKSGGLSGMFAGAKASPTSYGVIPEIAKILGRESFAISLGIGPIESRGAGAVVRSMLGQLSGVYCRDHDSVKLLRELGVSENIELGSDLCYAFQKRLQLPEKVEESRKYLLINFRRWPGFDTEANLDKWARAIGQLATDHDLRVHGLAMRGGANGDANLVKEVLRRLPGDIPTEFADGSEMSNEAVASLIASSTIVVTMRRQLALAAHVHAVPTVGIAYDPKVDAHFNEIGCPERAVRPFILPEEIKTTLAEALERGMRQDSKSAVTQYIERAEMSTETLFHRVRQCGQPSWMDSVAMALPKRVDLDEWLLTASNLPDAQEGGAVDSSVAEEEQEEKSEPQLEGPPRTVSAPVIELQNVGLRYPVHRRRGRQRERIRDNRWHGRSFWALRDLSFTVRRGDVVGIIGSNGSGKSSLSRLLAGVYLPDAGELSIQGRASLLALGSGFKQDLSGTDNVYINGALLGLSRSEIRERFDQIVEYSEIGDFINEPVRTYSAGMRSRLGFAIAIHLEPEILILDEVMATGDAQFKQKARESMLSLIEAAKAVIIISHQMSFLKKICNKVLWIEKGQLAQMGDPDEVIANYFASSGTQDGE